MTTSDCVRVTIFFGAYHYVGKFYVLDCPVPLILGMDFLSKSNQKLILEQSKLVWYIKGLGTSYQRAKLVMQNVKKASCSVNSIASQSNV